jgi:hypothetical protein
MIEKTFTDDIAKSISCCNKKNHRYLSDQKSDNYLLDRNTNICRFLSQDEDHFPSATAVRKE